MMAHFAKTYIKPLPDEFHSSDGKHINVTFVRGETGKMHHSAFADAGPTSGSSQRCAEALTALLVLQQTTL